jgi:hypothetical protein
LLSRKRTREAVVVVFLLAIVSMQLFGPLAERWEAQLEPILAKLAPAVSILPPALAGNAIRGAAEKDWAPLVWGTGLLAPYTLGCAWLFGRRLRAQYAGEVEEATARPTSHEATMEQGWRLPSRNFGISGPLAAVCEKELRYAVRSGQTLLSLAIPLLIVLFFAIAWGNPRTTPEPLRHTPGLFFPFAVAYAFLVLAPLMHNAFGLDGKGIQLLFLVPVRFEEVLLGKNLVHGFLILLETGLVWFLISVVVAPPGVGIIILTFGALLTATLVHFMVGNWLSLQFPRQIEFGRFRKRASQLNILLGLITQVAVMGAIAAIYAQTRPAGAWADPLAAVIYFGVGVGAFLVYGRSLHHAARFALTRREQLSAELCR